VERGILSSFFSMWSLCMVLRWDWIGLGCFRLDSLVDAFSFSVELDGWMSGWMEWNGMD